MSIDEAFEEAFAEDMTMATAGGAVGTYLDDRDKKKEGVVIEMPDEGFNALGDEPDREEGQTMVDLGSTGRKSYRKETASSLSDVRFQLYNEMDDIPASPNLFKTVGEAVQYLKRLAAGWKKQGYYSSSRKGRVPLNELDFTIAIVDKNGGELPDEIAEEASRKKHGGWGSSQYMHPNSDEIKTKAFLEGAPVKRYRNKAQFTCSRRVKNIYEKVFAGNAVYRAPQNIRESVQGLQERVKTRILALEEKVERGNTKAGEELRKRYKELVLLSESYLEADSEHSAAVLALELRKEGVPDAVAKKDKVFFPKSQESKVVAAMRKWQGTTPVIKMENHRVLCAGREYTIPLARGKAPEKVWALLTEGFTKIGVEPRVAEKAAGYAWNKLMPRLGVNEHNLSEGFFREAAHTMKLKNWKESINRLHRETVHRETFVWDKKGVKIELDSVVDYNDRKRWTVDVNGVEQKRFSTEREARNYFHDLIRQYDKAPAKESSPRGRIERLHEALNSPADDVANVNDPMTPGQPKIGLPGVGVQKEAAKAKYKVGDRVRVSPDNDNDGYNSFRNKTLIITHVDTEFDKEGGALYSFKTTDGKQVNSSLYDWELVRA